LNRDHPLSTLAQNNAFEWVDRRLELGLYTRSRVADIEQLVSLIPDKKKAFDWMIACLLSAHAEFLFKIVHEDDPRLWPALWATLELDGNQTPILFHSLGWRMIERSGITGLFGRKIAKFLPKPSRHDCLECLPEKTPRKRSRSKPH
jgi:hypothetical protein